MTRTAGAQIGCQRPSRFWGLGCPKIYHEAEDTLDFEKRKGKNITSPAVLELVYDTEGRPVTLHRLFITPDGRKA
ncbi:hypothetical protein, partial [Thiolapillus sp.]|uniref:hypothetical protein n=1 Tax=Thiolapillus sp. TaxID=2017437 RepID=UPI003AF70D92